MANGLDDIGQAPPRRLLPPTLPVELDPFVDAGMGAQFVEPDAIVPPTQAPPMVARELEAPVLPPPTVIPELLAAPDVQPRPVAPIDEQVPAVAPVDVEATPAEPPEIVFDEDVVVDPLAVWSEVQDEQANVSGLLDQRTVLRRQAQDLQVAIAAETDPAKRAELVAKQDETIAAVGVTDADLGDSRQALDMASAEDNARRHVAESREIQRTNQQIRDTLAVRQADRDIEDAEVERERETVRTKYTEAKAAHTQSMREELPVSTPLTVLAMLTEAINADTEKRPANFGPLMSQLYSQAREVASRRERAALSDVETGLEALDEVARRQARMKLDRAAADEAMVEHALSETHARLASARTDAEADALGGLVDRLERERESKKATSQAMADKEGRKAAGETADIALTRARTREAEAKAMGAKRKAARVGRGGRAKPEGSAVLFAPNQVAFPGTEDIAVEFENTPSGIKDATKAREILGFNGQLLNKINALEAAIEDADEQGVFHREKFDRSGTWAELQSQLNDLVPEVAKIGSGGFAATETDQKWAEQQLPETPGVWNTRKKALAKVAALRRRFADRARFALASQTRMRPAVAERLVARARPASVSQRDRATVLNERADEILVDEAQPRDTRIQALANLSANARRDAKAEGNEDDFLAIESAKLGEALRQTRDPDVRAAIRERLETLGGFATDREKQFRTRAYIPRKMAGELEMMKRSGADVEGEMERHEQQSREIRGSLDRETARDMTPSERSRLRLFPGVSDDIAAIEAEEAAEREDAAREAAEAESSAKPRRKGKR